ncbi:MAG: hypothetical protein JOZ29_16880 [Deltaproteobacteria bacterium]|nr:hypothetical protein [Deltaproteobacteria bacterium]
MTQFAACFEIHPHQIPVWKKTLVQAVPKVFADHPPSAAQCVRRIRSLRGID